MVKHRVVVAAEVQRLLPARVRGELRSLLTQLGEDTSLADEIHAAYLDEKASLKAYYLSLH